MQSSLYSRLLLEVDGTRFSNQGGKIMGPKLRTSLREKVLALSEEGYSLRVIAVHVGLRTHKDWTAEHWSKVIFSDESRFLLHRSDGRVYVRRMAGEEFKEDCVQPTVKHGGGGIMVWGCINAKGVEFLTKVDRREGWMGKVTSIFSKMHLSQPLTCWQSQVAEYFSRITLHVTPPGKLGNGLMTSKSQSWIGLHSHLISIQSKIFGTRLRQWPRNKIPQVLKNWGLL